MLPLFENMGVEVADERPYEIRPARADPGLDLRLRPDLRGRRELGADELRERFQDAFVRAWRGDVENDGYNRLVLRARLTWREVTVLRAVARYLRQAGTTFSDPYVEQALVAHPHIARLLVELFEARFDPDARATPTTAARLVEQIVHAIDAVESLDQDRILRSFLGRDRGDAAHELLPAGAGGGPKPYLSFKLDPTRLPLAAAAAPALRDLRLLAAHRGRAPARRQGRARRHPLVGPARRLPHRGARPDEGADGQERGDRAGRREGRLRRQAPAAGGDREALPRGRRAATARSSAGCSTSPTTSSAARSCRRRDVVRYDDDDPYLVVAADKGTATFSDIANAIAARVRLLARRRVRLGRLDGLRPQEDGHHRARRLGVGEAPLPRARARRPDARTSRSSGIGDMSGDVFGNGMLLSRAHPPDRRLQPPRTSSSTPIPDPATSFEERSRLFALPRSSWADYDTRADLRGRRRLPARGEVDPALARGARGARRRGARR